MPISIFFSTKSFDC